MEINVVGGGPAGLEAARVAAERGHNVVLFEAAPALGGQVRIGAGASWRGDLIGVIDWRAGELARLGVDIRLNRYAEAEDVLREAPDIVIIATGGIPDLDWIDGAQFCTSVWDILTGSVRAGEEIIVYDGTGRHPAPHCAEYLALAGRRVSLVSIDGYLAAELTYAERAIWKKRGYELAIAMRFDHRLTRIARDGNRLTAHFVNEVTGAAFEQSADQIAVERGTVPADALYGELRARAANDGVTDIECLLAGRPQPAAAAGFAVYRIGDAVASRNIHAAVLDALRLCCTL